MPGTQVEFASHHALSAVVFRSDDRPDHVLVFGIAGTPIHSRYAVRNPDKLGAAIVPRRLARRRDKTWKP
ncbi:hypothetical protein AB0D04_38625 [Streptomyces sp. NPDC048483]|uniref:hypothetical protein n=1 Tax=Streptomyces sp. NPDC048483 TaxID=3154927 RepID=UPI00344139E5